MKMERADSFSTLEIDVEIPCDKFVARPQPVSGLMLSERAAVGSNGQSRGVKRRGDRESSSILILPGSLRARSRRRRG